ncbi:hypothetical protein BXY66_0300 [Shimia isoporae]|uniref:YVTN family beta-propeller protein n=1 Tax=Shimia isoporae TaxID=647720 RepID=A0A4R1NJR9_9RHOB|nr:hypothetical protein [Shimia isoporae]TCL08265.1 hypothetical protein BXY66_0300 [Shimia isoporae]
MVEGTSKLTRRSFLAGAGAMALASGGLGARSAMAKTSLTHGERIVFAAGDKGRVAAVDLKKRRLETVLEVGYEIGQIVPSNKYNALFVTDPAGKAATVMDLASREVVARNELGHSAEIAIANTDDSGIAYGGSDGVVSVWAHRTNSEIARVPGFAPITSMTFGQRGRSLYVVQDGRREIAVVDLAANMALAPITLEGDASVALDGVSRSLDGGTGFVSLPDLGKVAILDLTQNSLYATLNVPADPRRVYASGDGLHFLVPHGTAQSVTVISSESLSVMRSIDVGYPVAEIITGWLDLFAFAIPENGNEIAVIDLQQYREVGRLRLSGRAGHGVVTSDTRQIALTLPEQGRLAVIETGTQSLAKSIRTKVAQAQPPQMAVSGNICH